MNTVIKEAISSCKFCKAPLEERFIDIVLPEGVNHSKEESSTNSLPTYICSECFLVQEDSGMPANPEQVFVSSFSSTWLNDMNQYIDRVFKRFDMTDHNLIVELTGHEDHLSKREALIFGSKGLHALIDMHGKADLLICKDALAYAHDINDFVSAIKLYLKPTGVATLEFLHLLPLMESSQFDVPFTGTVPYFSFTTIDTIFKHHGLTIFDIEECQAKGCLRVYVKHYENGSKRITNKPPALRGQERDKGMSSVSHYINFKKQVDRNKIGV
jgi:hypothetical protein